jgi:two-component system chemotaxis response regulator CheB
VARKDIIVVGASAGGMEALTTLAGALPRGLQASVFVVWHMPAGMKSILPRLLSKASGLPAENPVDGAPILPGRIYVAPSDHHMLLEQGFVRLTRGPKENRFRPAVDPLFRSAAYVYGSRVTGVVLSGALDDGTAGLWTIKLRGGTAIVQDPAEALNGSMPLNALQHVDVDYKLQAAAIGQLIGKLARLEAPAPRRLPDKEEKKLEHEIRIAKERNALEQNILNFGELSPFTCPECRGVLTLLREGNIVRFRCHTGHAFSSDALLHATSEQVEERLWDAVRALDETVMLLNTLGEEFKKSGNESAAEKCFKKAKEAHERADPIREAAFRSEQLTTEQLADEEPDAEQVPKRASGAGT